LEKGKRTVAVKNFNFKNSIKIEKLPYLMMMQNSSLEPIGDTPSWIFEIEFFNGPFT